MDALKRELIACATAKHGTGITPCSGKEKLDDCFTEADGMLYFWYNTPDNNTHVEQGGVNGTKIRVRLSGRA